MIKTHETFIEKNGNVVDAEITEAIEQAKVSLKRITDKFKAQSI